MEVRVQRAIVGKALALGVACGGGGEDSDSATDTDTRTDSGLSSTTRTFVDEGRACAISSTDAVDVYALWSGTAPDDSLVADAAPTVIVFIDHCVSSSVHDISAECQATVDGNTLLVSAFASYVAPPTQVSDCIPFWVSCAAPTLPAGTWTLQYGTATADFDIPQTAPPPCAGPAR